MFFLLSLNAAVTNSDSGVHCSVQSLILRGISDLFNLPKLDINASCKQNTKSNIYNISGKGQ